MSRHLGDYALSTIVYGKFTTYRPSTGAAFTLAGTPALSVYKDNSATQSTTGVTLTADFDGVTGLHHFAIDTSADGTFYSTGANFDIVITTGTVDSVSVVGTVVGSFSLSKTASLKPTTAGRTLDVSAGGEAGVDWANVGSPTTTLNLSGTSTKALEPTTAGRTLDVTTTGEAGLDLSNANVPAGAIPWLGIFDNGTAQSATGTTLVVRAANTDNSIKAGQTLFAYGSTQGYWQSVLIDSVSGDTLTIAAWPLATPTGTITYYVQGTPLGSAALLPDVNVSKWNTTTVSGDGDWADFDTRLPTSAQLAYIVGNSGTGYAVTFTTSGGTTTNAVLALVDGATASVTDNQYNGRILVFLDGTLKGVVANITDYDGTTKYATITGIPTAPTSSHTARLL